MQYDLFDSLSSTLIDIAPQAELPKVLTQHPHGVQLGTHFVPYQLRRSKRRSIGFIVGEQGLSVTAPRWVNAAEITSAILSKQRWILAKLKEQQSRPAPIIPTWTSGTSLPYLGHQATLQMQLGTATSFDPETKLLTLNLPSDAVPEQCQKHVHTWLMDQARQQFGERLPFFAEQLGVQYHSFSLTNAKTIWGSCCPNKKIRLNWRLIHLSPRLIDYVVAHELAHLLEMNHSARFWATVGKIFPDYVTARSELRKCDMRSLPRF